MKSTQITLVQNSWSSVLPTSKKAAKLFYARLFEIDPSTKTLFQGSMVTQGRKLMEMITAAVDGLEDLDGLVPVVQDLGRRHSGYGVTDDHYDSVGSALLWMLEQSLGDAFTPDVKAAWIETYTLLSGVMKDTSAEVVEANESTKSDDSDDSGGAGVPAVRPEWVGHVCCGLASRPFTAAGSAIGMYCENHGSKYWITAEGACLP